MNTRFFLMIACLAWAMPPLALGQENVAVGLTSLHLKEPLTESATLTGIAGNELSQGEIQDPVQTKLAVEVEIYAEGEFKVAIGDQVFTRTGAGCDTPANFAPFLFTNLTTYARHRLTVSAAALQSVTLMLTPDTSVELVKKRGLEANIKTFKIYLDGLESNQIDEFAPTNCAPHLKTWDLELRPDNGIRVANKLNAPWSRAEENLSEDAVAGDASWPELGPGKSTNQAVMSFKWGVNVGRLLTGREAGQIRLRETNLTARTFAPISLLYTLTSTNWNELVVVTNVYYTTNYYGNDEVITTNGILRQIKTALAVANITTNTAWQYYLKFYTTNWITAQDPVNGFCTLATNATAFVTYTIESPNQTTNWLRLTESRNQTNYLSDLQYDSTNRVWSLKTGIAGDYVTLYRTITVDVPNSNRVEKVECKNVAGTNAFCSAEKYHLYPWGWELVTVTNNLGMSPLVTTYDFYTDGESIGDYGKLKWIIYPDGSWEKREYNPFTEYGAYPGLLWRIYRPWKDLPSHPEDAKLTNSWISEYSYYDNGASFSAGSLVHKYDPTGAGDISDISTRLERFGEALYYNEGDPFFNYREEINELGNLYGYGQFSATHTFTLAAGCDLADQPRAEHYTNYVQKSFYYQWGFYDATNYVFLTNTEDKPHWRMSAVIGGNPGVWSAGEGPGISTDQIEGVTIDLIYLVPRQSTRETKIMQDSKVVLRENWVISAYESGNFELALLNQYLQYHDSLGHVTNVVRRDPQTHALRTLYSANWKDANGQDGNLKRSETDEDGVETTYTYDGLKRIESMVKKGVSPANDLTTTFAYDAYGRKLSVILSGGGLSLTNSFTYDLAGRLWTQTDTNALTTSYSYNGLTETITLPGGATQITEKYRDGRLKSVTGSALVAEYYGYAQNEHYYLDEEPFSPHNVNTVTNGLPNSARWRRQATDCREIPIEEHVRGLYGVITNLYSMDIKGLPDGFAQAGPDSLWAGWEGYHNVPSNAIPRWLIYDTAGAIMGNTNFSHLGALSRELGVIIDLTNALEILENRTGYELAGTNWFWVSTNLVYLQDGSDTPTMASISKEQITGLGATTKTVRTDIDADTNVTTITVQVDRTNKKVTQITDTAQSTLNATNITINGLLTQESTPTVANPSVYYYDGLERPVRVQDPLGFTTGTKYDPATGQVRATTNQLGQVTWFDYYPSNHLNAGRLKIKTETNGKKTYYEYTARGELQHLWGDVPYPAEYKYSAYGELTNLVIFRSGSSWTNPTWPGGTGDNTYWRYDEASGLLLAKKDALNREVTYDYYTNGFPKTRIWANGTGLTNMYGEWGYLVKLDYSGNTPDVLFTNDTFTAYTRSGLPRMVADATGTHTLAYDHASRLIGDACTAGAFAGLTVSNKFNPLYGRSRVSLHGASATVQHDFAYDTYGRLGSVTNGNYSVAYAFLANSDLIQTATSKYGTTPVLSTYRTWDGGFRLGSIQHSLGSILGSSHVYTYDSVNRRTRATLADNSYWSYAYNDRNEVQSGRRYWADSSPVSGQQFEYRYDNIGNRTTAQTGGDTAGANLRTTTYSVNTANQYTQLLTPGYKDILGTANAGQSVQVNTNATDRKTEYFHRELTVNNTNAVVYQNVTVTSATNSTGGNFVFPPYTTTNSYDLDGNLTQDGRWTNTWDGENRLITMEANAGVPSGAKRKLEFTYDFQGRRSTKKVYNWNGSAYQLATHTKFLYDGWNLIAELNATNHQVLRSYAWGLDLGGVSGAAGGVGGLWLVTFNSSPATNCFVAYDGNGNVMALVNAVTSPPYQPALAQYEHGPFGDPIRVNGPLAKANPFRFSTKYWDDESGLMYYGRRYYNSIVGRWLSRDASAEKGGLNLYAFVANQSTIDIDTIGLSGYYRGGHHPATMQLANTLPDGPGTEYLKKFTIPVIKPHVYDTPHRVFNVDVSSYFKRWIDITHVTREQFAQSEQLARRFVNDVMNQPKNSSIGAYLGKVMNGAKALKAAVILGAAFQGYSAYANSGELISSLKSYQHSVASGDTPMQDLDAIGAAVAVQNMTGDYFTSMYVLDALLP